MQKQRKYQIKKEIKKEFGIKNGNSYWGDRVDLSNTPKYQQGQDPKKYINQIYQYLGNVSRDASAEVIIVPNTDSNKIEQFMPNIIALAKEGKYGELGKMSGFSD